jgi:hypothetical protein
VAAANPEHGLGLAAVVAYALVELRGLLEQRQLARALGGLGRVVVALLE